MNVTGQVEDIIVREVNGRDGPAAVYDVMVGGKKYGHGFCEPPFKKGDNITFEVYVRKNGKYTNYDIQFGTVRESVATAATQDAPQTPDGYDRNRSIVRQNSLSHATALVCASGVSTLDNVATIAIDIAREFEAYSMCEKD
jgi:hypothetical protein